MFHRCIVYPYLCLHVHSLKGPWQLISVIGKCKRNICWESICKLFLLFLELTVNQLGLMTVMIITSSKRELWSDNWERHVSHHGTIPLTKHKKWGAGWQIMNKWFKLDWLVITNVHGESEKEKGDIRHLNFYFKRYTNGTKNALSINKETLPPVLQDWTKATFHISSWVADLDKSIFQPLGLSTSKARTW